MRKDLTLNADEIERTIAKLAQRISDRFPESGLSRVCGKLLIIADHASERSDWISRPIFSIRIVSILLIAVILAGLVGSMTAIKLPEGGINFFDFVQGLESGINDIVLIAAAIYFLSSLETRLKRKKALVALHELRSIAHIIDMHQLTKDPERVLKNAKPTMSSPQYKSMTPYLLARYLDYCAEMLALTGKIAALYAQTLQDTAAVTAVNEIEDLTTGLSRKIWQKLMVLYQMLEIRDEK